MNYLFTRPSISFSEHQVAFTYLLLRCRLSDLQKGFDVVAVWTQSLSYCSKAERKKKVDAFGGYYCDWCTIVVLASSTPALLSKKTTSEPVSSSCMHSCQHEGGYDMFFCTCPVHSQL